MTLFQSVDKLIENISVTDRQEDSIDCSFNNLKISLLKENSNLKIEDVFLNGSYERDTIIRPLDDIDLFAVIPFEEYEDNGLEPKPQTVLSKFKNYLNGLSDYKDKVKQDRPCVTVVLCDKNFDVLPTLKKNGSYYIPNTDLSGWVYTDPKTHTDNLNRVNKNRNYRVKSIVKAVKYWKRENNYSIPSFHVEEVAVGIFGLYNFINLEEGIRMWFKYAENYLDSTLFKTYNEYSKMKEKIQAIQEKLTEAKKLYDDKKEGEAKRLWKDVFGNEFPALDTEEAKSFSKSLSEGTLKYGSTSGLSTSVGSAIAASKGFYGEQIH